MKNDLQIASEVLMGLWGNGDDRKNRLTKSGYNYEKIQGIVNDLINGKDVQQIITITGSNILDVHVNLKKYKGIRLMFEVD